MSFREIDPKTLEGNPFVRIGDQWMLVTAGDQKQYNTMTASWGGLGVMWGKNVAYTVIRPQRFTYEFMEACDTYTLSFYPKEWKPALNLCGSKSGRDVDKAKETGLIPVFDEQAPYFEQAELVLVCRKLYAQPIDPACFTDASCDAKWYAAKDYHKQYISEIVKVLVKETL
ncbi:MAG: flavin reductase family protein [Clostridiales bacterium]|jgi:flavin reductase (DIM6/NTAB) family NADH-FMN oxidoreductase RutF|nr:flavin reductase family protein [Clostridiales bacterium]